MSLADYRKKRDFGATREPKGRGAQKTGSSFVVQKHAARRLHYDLRLEMDGVLKSWAVTRGPSLVPGEKRLAVHVEDHPLDYRNFEGVIPEGQYGAGEVIVWDKGVSIPEGDPHKGYAKGHLDFELRDKSSQAVGISCAWRESRARSTTTGFSSKAKTNLHERLRTKTYSTRCRAR